MARPIKNRKVFDPPKMYGFKPFGIALCEAENVILQFDEYESLKLLNYDNLSQEEAAELMNVSRPTMTRIYNSALKKVSQAFVEGKTILIKGGNIEYDKDWYKCTKCYKLIDGLQNHIACAGCTRFNSDELVKLENLFENPQNGS